MAKLHLYENVSKHNKTKDCWLVISGKVYDVSPFMDDHPGGGEVLLSSTGKDATTDFEDTGHSKEAKELMGKYCIGEIDMATVPRNRTYIPNELYEANKTSAFYVKIMTILLPILFLGWALSVRLYTVK